MAAVFCLIFLPALAAVGFMIKTIQGDMSAGAAIAAFTFVSLAAFVFSAVLSMIRHAEDEPV